jgi:hypothetical protein
VEKPVKRQQGRNGKSQITPSEMRKALLRSGYLIEQRCEDIMRERIFLVETNTAYPDEFTGKSRELDIRASCFGKAGPKEIDFVTGMILCECQNNIQPVVFFTKEPIAGFLHYYQIKVSGMPSKILAKDATGESFIALSEFLDMKKYHHYCKGRIATQYCTFQLRKDKPEWIALHQDEQHDSIMVLIAALEAEIKDFHESWVPPRDEPEPIDIEIYYPLIVLQGALYEAFPVGRRLKLKKTNHVQFRKEYHSANRHDTYQIDIITEPFLANYLTLVENEVKKTARLLRRRNPIVRKSIAEIVTKAKGAKSADEIKAALKFEQQGPV